MSLNIKDYINFKNEDERIDILKELLLLPPKAKEIKTFYYKGIYSDETVKCNIKGYLRGINGIHTLIIDLNNNNHPIHPDYLRNMQTNTFKITD